MSARTTPTGWLVGALVAVAVAAALFAGVWWRLMPTPAGGPRSVATIDAAAQFENERGIGFMGQFEFLKAEEAFEAARVLAPDSWVPRFNQAVARMNRTDDGAQQSAIELLGPLAELPEARLRALYCQGLAALYLGDAKGALARFGPVAQARPLDGYAQFYAGQCLELTGDLKGALDCYERAASIDPLLRSAFLGVQRTSARLDDSARADAALQQFERLTDDPRSTLAEFKYTRMGPLAEVLAETEGDSALRGPAERPAGARNVFGEPTALALTGVPERFPTPTLARPTVVDLNGDGACDLIFAATGSTPGMACMRAPGGEGWIASVDHPLVRVHARGMLWADLDNDGHVDAVVNPADATGAYCLYQQSDGTWVRGSIGGEAPLRALLLADLDYDGDVDVLAADEAMPYVCINRTARTFAAQPITGATDGGRVVRASAGDLNGNGDCELLLVREGTEGPRVQVWSLKPLAGWTRAGQWEPAVPARAALAFRGDDGRAVLLAALVEGDASDSHDTLAVWELTGDGMQEVFRRALPGALDLTVGPLDGWGEPLLLVTGAAPGAAGSSFAHVLDARGNLVQRLEGAESLRLDQATPVVLDADGAQLVIPALHDGGVPRLLPPGDARGPKAVVSFRGRIDPSQQMRSNASGIGTSFVARAGGRWVAGSALPHTTVGDGLQQSLEPVVIGLSGAPAASFVTISWPDGVTQTELDVRAGACTMVETQRQISSCPVIFAWNGREHAFVTDCLGVGGLGYLATVHEGADGTFVPEYAPPRPWEHVVLGGNDALAPREGQYDIRLSEPMEEACYLDAARLVALDVPEGWRVALDERMGVRGPEPTGKPRTYRDACSPVRATAQAGSTALAGATAHAGATAPAVAMATDATAALAQRDGVAADLGPADPRFIGRLASEASIVLEFEQPLDAHAGEPMLLVDGWVEYPYCQTNFGMWQAGAPYQAPTVEGRDPASGEWIVLVQEYGYPAGMPRQAVFPLPIERLPKGCSALRMRTTMEIYLDRVQVAWHEPCPGLTRAQARLASAECAFAGFAERLAKPQRRPDYRYAVRKPLWDCRMQVGAYTAYGDCTPLLAASDDAVAIFGAGEEVRLRFDALPPPGVGRARTWVLEVDGWCKDMDRYTGAGRTIEPLPMRGRSTPARDALHAQFNTRIAGGR